MQAALLLLTSQRAFVASRNSETLPPILLRAVTRSLSVSANQLAEEGSQPAATASTSSASQQAHVKATKAFESELSGALSCMEHTSALKSMAVFAKLAAAELDQKSFVSCSSAPAVARGEPARILCKEKGVSKAAGRSKSKTGAEAKHTVRGTGAASAKTQARAGGRASDTGE